MTRQDRLSGANSVWILLRASLIMAMLTGFPANYFAATNEIASQSLPPSVADDIGVSKGNGPENRAVPKDDVSAALKFAKQALPNDPGKLVAGALSNVALQGDLKDERSSGQVRRLRDGFLWNGRPPDSIFGSQRFQQNMLFLLEGASAGTRVVGGKVALPNEYPNCVLISGPDPTDYFCTGVLVSNQLVLTAGHCMDDHTPAHVTFCTNTNDPLARTFGVLGSPERHPSYSPAQDYANDVMLLVLDQAVSPNLQPARIAQSSAFVPDKLRIVTLVGFGYDDRAASQGFGVKRWGDTAVVSPDCRPPINSVYGGHPDLEFIAGDQRVDTCKGDSGGPAFWLDAGGNRLLVGTTSRWTKNHTRTCGDGGIYVRADKYRDWMTQVAAQRHVAPPSQ
jgi:hypothetical protein